MSDRTAERCQAQPKKSAENFASGTIGLKTYIPGTIVRVVVRHRCVIHR